MSIAHEIEVAAKGDPIAMMAAIEAMSADENQDWTNERSTYTFDDGSALVFIGPHVERVEPKEDI